MAPAMRLATSTLRGSLKAPSFVYRNSAFAAARCYSSKTQVLDPRRRDPHPDIIH